MIKKTMRHAADMIKKTVRHAANAAGIDIHKDLGTGWRWSYNVDDYYPVDPIPRWGHGTPHPQIAEILNRQRSDFSALLRRFSQCSGVLASVPLEGDPDSKIPLWRNGGFENFDAAALVGMLVAIHQPATWRSGPGTQRSLRAMQFNIRASRRRLFRWTPTPAGSARYAIKSSASGLRTATCPCLINSREATSCFWMDRTASFRCDGVLLGTDASTKARRHYSLFRAVYFGRNDVMPAAVV